MKRFRRSAVILVFLLITLSLFQCKERNTKESLSNADFIAFEEASPVDVGMDASVLDKMEVAIQTNEYPNIHSVLILKDKKLVYEQYFPGNDELWGDSLGIVQNSSFRLHDVRSISKSIVSACVGLAIEQGHIKNVDQKIFEFFPEYQQYDTGLRSEITIRHLLTMTSGMEWNEEVPYSDPENSEIRMTNSPDPVEFILSRPMEIEPGVVWNYNGGTTQLLAIIIKKTSGMEIDDFAAQHLFDPLGVKNFRWTYFPNLDLPAAASGLRLTSRDLLRFAMLYASEGNWQGAQLLPKKWVDDSFKSYVQFGRNRKLGYGYQFWIFDGSTIYEDLDQPIYAAVGNGDQRIYFDLVNDLIVITTAGNYNNWSIKKDSEALLTDFIYPAFKN